MIIYLKKRKFLLLLLFSEYFFKISNNLIDKNLLNKSLINFNSKNKKFCDIKRNWIWLYIFKYFKKLY